MNYNIVGYINLLSVLNSNGNTSKQISQYFDGLSSEGVFVAQSTNLLDMFKVVYSL